MTGTAHQARAIRLALPLVVVATALAGCSPTAAPEAPGTPPESTTAPSGRESDEEIDPIACVLGEWRISEEQMQLYYDAVSAGVEGTTFTVHGTTDLVFEDTDYSYFPGFSLDLDVSGTHASARLFGSITGNYVVDGGEITTNNDSNIISMEVEAAGFAIDGTELASEMLTAYPVSNAPYECLPGPELIIDMETGYGRVPILLVPATPTTSPD